MDEIVWQSPGATKYLTVKKTGNFFYAERHGKDSVAFILVDNNKDNKKYGLVKELKDPIGGYLVTAFGGSLDKKNLTHTEIVVAEVKEESGYTVSKDRIEYIGKRYVSTQMNQFCYLFLVDVTDLEQGERVPQNETEALASVVWVSDEDIAQGPDWKAQSILLFIKGVK